MKRRRGFTLVECLIASLVILIVVGTLAVGIKFFVEGSKRIELRTNILMVASAEVSRLEREGYPEPMEITRQDTIGSSRFTIYTTVAQITPHSRELIVSVSGNIGNEVASLDLVRQFYD